jgi:hypothetical protein
VAIRRAAGRRWRVATGRDRSEVAEANGRAGGVTGTHTGREPRDLVSRVPDGRQWLQPPGLPDDSAVRKDDPHPQAATAFGLLTVKPAPMSVST